MSLTKLPDLSVKALTGSPLSFGLDDDALAAWDSRVHGATGDNTISMYDAIGASFEGEGVTAKRISAALRGIGNQDVVVNINSPGGDFFEGVAIYNLLREHPARVTVQVVGLAASAASIIAMAGDEIKVAESGFLMIHNAWALTIGNRHDMLAAAALLEPFDMAMAKVYAARTGRSVPDVQSWMDAEKWFSGEEAVAAGMADSLLDSDLVTEDGSAQALSSVRRIEAALIAQGMPRQERRALMAQFRDGKSGAAISDHPGKSGAAGTERAAELASLIQSLFTRS